MREEERRERKRESRREERGRGPSRENMGFSREESSSTHPSFEV